MATFTIKIDDAIAGGIKAAREDFNASLPAVMGKDGVTPVAPTPSSFADDAAYLSSRVVGVVQSWADQYGISTASQSQAKSDFLDSLPDDKRAAAQAALAAIIPDAVTA